MRDDERILKVLMQCYDEAKPLSESLDVEMINSLSDSDSTEVRAWLARALAYQNSDTQAVALLCKLSQDIESSVRVEAVDSISEFATLESFDMLCRAAVDEDELVRAYAAFGIAYVGKKLYPEKALQTLFNMVQTEKSERVFVDIYEGLYILGRNEMLEELIKLYGSSDYHVQCAALNALAELVCSQNVNAIHRFANVLDASVCVPAVAGAIERLTQKCQKVLHE